MFYNEIFPWYISVTTHVLDFRFGTQSRKKETEEDALCVNVEMLMEQYLVHATQQVTQSVQIFSYERLSRVSAQFQVSSLWKFQTANSVRTVFLYSLTVL